MFYGYNYPDYYGDFNFDRFGANSEELIAIIAVIGVIVSMFAIVVGITLFIFQGIGLYTIGDKRKMKNCFLAFIPIANIYFLGKIADDIGLTMNKKTNHATRLLITVIATLVFSFALIPISIVATVFANHALPLIMVIVLLSLIVSALAICAVVFEFIALYCIYKEYNPKNAVLFIVLGILFDVVTPFFLFAIRNRKSGYELWAEQQMAAKSAQPAPTPEVIHTEAPSDEAPSDEVPVEAPTDEIPVEAPTDEVPVEEPTDTYQSPEEK